MKTSDEARRKVHHFRRLLNEALGQMEIESIKKQENPENIGVVPTRKPNMTGVKIILNVPLEELEHKKHEVPFLLCQEINQSKNQESEQNRDNQR